MQNHNLMPPASKGRLFHREFFEGRPGHRTLKESYTYQDLWEYFVLSTAGAIEARKLGTSSTRAEREQACAYVLANARPPDAEDEAAMCRVVERCGIEAALYLVDTFADTSWEEANPLRNGAPPFKACLPHLEDTLGFLERLYREAR